MAISVERLAEIRLQLTIAKGRRVTAESARAMPLVAAPLNWSLIDLCDATDDLLGELDRRTAKLQTATEALEKIDKLQFEVTGKEDGEAVAIAMNEIEEVIIAALKLIGEKP